MLIKDATRAQGLTEYALIILLVVLIVIIVLSLMGAPVANMFSSVVAAF